MLSVSKLAVALGSSASGGKGMVVSRQGNSVSWHWPRQCLVFTGSGMVTKQPEAQSSVSGPE